MMQQPPPSHEAEMAGPFPPDLHDVRHLRLKAGLLLLWVLVSFVAMYIAIVVVYCWAMNRFERQDAAQAERMSASLAPPSRPHG